MTHAHDHTPTYRFCPKCGGPLSLQPITEKGRSHPVCESCSFIFYQNPKVATGVICTLEGGIVLLKRAIEPSYGKWVFPGGYMDRGETVEEAAIREAREETNLEVRIRSLLNIYSYPGAAVIIVVYEGDVTGGTLQPLDETLEVHPFPPEAIPWDDLAFPSTRDALRDYLARYPVPR